MCGTLQITARLKFKWSWPYGDAGVAPTGRASWKGCLTASPQGHVILYPISTLPEHLHSTIPSYAKIPENTLTEKKNSFSLFNAHYLFDRSPQLPHPLHWETQPHPLIHNHSILSAQGERSRLLESHPMFRLLRLSLSYRCFLFINFY